MQSVRLFLFVFIFLSFLSKRNSSHGDGHDAALELENARHVIASFFGCKDHELVFTSNASESNRIALTMGRGRACCVATDHSSVLHNVEHRIRVDRCGQIDLYHLEATFKSLQPLLFSFCYGNNETGVLVDNLDAVVALRDQWAPRCLLHCDLSQSFGKVRVDHLLRIVDLATISAHKLHGPKGVGGLFVREKLRIEEFQGTPSVALILGFANAVKLALSSGLFDYASVKQHLVARLQEIANVRINPTSSEVPILSVHVANVDSSQLVRLLSTKYKLMCSSGSACSKQKTSHVLLAMGLHAHESVRISFCRTTTRREVDELIERFKAGIEEIKSSK